MCEEIVDVSKFWEYVMQMQKFIIDYSPLTDGGEEDSSSNFNLFSQSFVSTPFSNGAYSCSDSG